MTPAAAHFRATIVTTALVCAVGLPRARAQDASAWDTTAHAAARLLAGAARNSAGAAQRARLRAGIEIRLDPGWKTYWRYPGDSGVPPKLDVAGSDNVESVNMLWPAPERFADGAGGHSIGYMGDVVFPLRIIAKDAAKPASLHVKFGYAICGNLCVPAQADLRLMLPGKGGEEEPALAAAQARVPRRVPLGAGAGLAIRSVHREADGAHGRIVVEIFAPNAAPVDLFVEGPTPDWALPLPAPIAPAPGDAPGLRRFAFELDGLPPGASAKDATLTFTAVSPDDAIEVETHLD